jgi:predicted metal-dependent hydrolase
MNHSRRFWRLVVSHEPRWRQLDAALTCGWRAVPGWAIG